MRTNYEHFKIKRFEMKATESLYSPSPVGFKNIFQIFYVQFYLIANSARKKMITTTSSSVVEWWF